jgi:hypothetical protein
MLNCLRRHIFNKNIKTRNQMITDENNNTLIVTVE